MTAKIRWVAGLAAATMLLMTTATAFGYNGQVEGIVGVAAQGTITCSEPFTVTATILDANGAPLAGQSVAWSFDTTQSSSDNIGKSPTVTDAKGVAATTVALGAVSGERRIRATAGDVSAAGVVDQTCIGLPRTDTLPAQAPAGGVPIVVGLLLVVTGLVGGAFALRRLA